MAKVEQFPGQTGENIKTEDIEKQKTKEIPGVKADEESGAQQGASGASADPRMPDDSLLMGSSTGKNSGPEADGNRDKNGPAEGEESGRGRILPYGRIFSGGGQGNRKLSYEEQIKQHRGRIRARRAFAALIAVIIVLLAVLYFNTRHFNRAELVKVRDFVAEEGASCVNFDGNVLQYGPNGAACASKSGRVKWAVTYEMDQPIISISGDIAAIADYGGTTIYVMNTRKQLYTVSTSLPIHKVSASESGEVAAVLDDKTKSWIRLYSDEGKEIAYFIRSMEENGYPMDVAVSPDGKTVCVSSLLMKEDSVITNLSFYNFGKAGKDYDQHMVGNFVYTNEVFPYIKFMGNKACAAASNARLVVFDTSGTVPQNSVNNMLTEDLQGIFRSGDRIGLLFTDLTRENLYRLDLYGRSGKKEGSVGFTMVYDDIQIKGNRVYINNEQTMQIYTTDGREIFNGGFDRAVRVLIPPSGMSGIAVVAENEIDKVNLR